MEPSEEEAQQTEPVCMCVERIRCQLGAVCRVCASRAVGFASLLSFYLSSACCCCTTNAGHKFCTGVARDGHGSSALGEYLELKRARERGWGSGRGAVCVCVCV